MADLAPSNESLHRRALRLSIGVAMVFTLTQLMAWPLAHLAPFMTAVLLQDSAPMPLARGWFIFRMALLSVSCGLVLALFLVQFPLVMVLLICAFLYGLYVFIIRSCDHMLAVIAGVVGVVAIPYLVLIKPEVGAIGSIGILADFAVTIIGAWITWYLLPLSETPPQGHVGKPVSHQAASAMGFNMMLVLAPLLVAHLAFGWSTLLVLIYAVIFTTAYDSKAGFDTGLKMVIANGVYGGLGMLLVYEFCVMMPSLPFMVVIVALAIFIFGLKIFGGGLTSPYWASGLNGFLILLGSALLADNGFALGATANRVWQIVMATAYVSFTLAVLAMIRDKFARAAPAQV
jgi:hypothetical protein